MRSVLLAVLALSAASGQAQVVPDTLDPRGYFPLAVGNEWEYRVYYERPASPLRPKDESRTEYLRYRILSAEANTFGVVEEVFSEAGELLDATTATVRYDSALASVVTDVNTPRPFFPCGLDLPLGWDGGSAEDVCWLGADRDASLPGFLSEVDPDRTKRFYGYSESASAIHGVGFTSWSWLPDGCNLFCDSESWTLTYARVDGTTYGARAVAAEAAPETAALRVYPNPASAALMVEGRGTRLGVYGALGRWVLTRMVQPEAPAHLGVGELPAGVYVVRRGAEAAVVTVR